jgi:hypothetical protein
VGPPNRRTRSERINGPQRIWSRVAGCCDDTANGEGLRCASLLAFLLTLSECRCL